MMYEQQLSHLPASVDDMYGKDRGPFAEALCGDRARLRPDRRRPTYRRASACDDVREPALRPKHREGAWRQARAHRGVEGRGRERLLVSMPIRPTARDRSTEVRPGPRSPTIIPPCSPPSNPRVTRRDRLITSRFCLDDLLEGGCDKRWSRSFRLRIRPCKRQVRRLRTTLAGLAVGRRAKMVEEGRRVQTVWIFGPAGRQVDPCRTVRASQGRSLLRIGITATFSGYAGEALRHPRRAPPQIHPYADLLRLGPLRRRRHE